MNGTVRIRNLSTIIPRRHKGWGERGQSAPPPLDFFGFKFLFLYRLPKALAQLLFAR